MVIELLKNVVLAQVLAKKGCIYFAEKTMIELMELCTFVQEFHPERFDGPIKRFRLFNLPNETLPYFEEEGMSRVIAQEYATFATNCYFKKNFANLVEELMNPDTKRLKIAATDAYVKFYKFMKGCSMYYRSIELQGIHFLHCPNLKCHSRVSVYQFTIIRAKVVYYVLGIEKIQEFMKFLLNEYPFIAKWVTCLEKNGLFMHNVKFWSAKKTISEILD